MTEPKYVKIPVEIRDKWLSSELGLTELTNALRAAPSVETLGLSNIERHSFVEWYESAEPDDTILCRFSDLQSLAKPEQSGGVVSQARIYELVNSRDFTEDMTTEQMTKAIYNLQLPAPPVQASEAQGMDLNRKTLADIVSRTAIASVNQADWAGNCADAILAHLQQAPQGVGERHFDIENVIRAHLNSMPVNFDHNEEAMKLVQKLAPIKVAAHQ